MLDVGETGLARRLVVEEGCDCDAVLMTNRGEAMETEVVEKTKHAESLCGIQQTGLYCAVGTSNAIFVSRKGLGCCSKWSRTSHIPLQSHPHKMPTHPRLRADFTHLPGAAICSNSTNLCNGKKDRTSRSTFEVTVDSCPVCSSLHFWSRCTMKYKHCHILWDCRTCALNPPSAQRSK